MFKFVVSAYKINNGLNPQRMYIIGEQQKGVALRLPGFSNSIEEAKQFDSYEEGEKAIAEVASDPEKQQWNYFRVGRVFVRP